ncbi:MAG: LysR family transcriptional regulator [Steroidobacteraceae bacterium]
MNEAPVRINYKHLRYFQQVAREGSIAAAARRLHVAPQTVSAQLLTLESSLGRPLFDRVGRRLVLTTDGEVALDYAESIFGLGLELRSVLSGRARPRSIAFRVGIADRVPKLLAARVLEPVLSRHRDVLELTCEEGDADDLFGRLAAHRLDAVLADQPAPPHLARAMRARKLAESGVSFMASPALAASLRGRFPDCLAGARLIQWPAGSPTGSAIDAWLAERGVAPRVVARCDDSALMKVLAQRGHGIACVPTTIEREVARQHGLRRVGRVAELAEPLYVIEPLRRRPHPMLAELVPPAPERATTRAAGVRRA